MVSKSRFNIMLSKDADIILNVMVKEGKRLYGNGVSRSKIIGDLILRSDPVKRLKEEAKVLQQDLHTTIERARELEKKKKS